MRKVIAVESQRCTGCGICELICSSSKEEVFNRRMSRIRVVSIEPTIDLALTCRFCEEPACVRACPRDALRQNEDGIVVVDQDKCDCCGWCIEACDFGTIMLHHKKHAVMVCDLCDGQPKCVNWCPTEALHLVNPSIVADKARISAVKKLFQGEK